LIVDLNRKTGATILVVTHDLHSTFLIATRIAVLDQGRIIEEGPPEAIRHSNDPVVAQFLAAGASDGTEADLTRDPHQLTRDDRFQSDEQRRTDQAAFNCALRCSRSHQVRNPAGGNLGLVAARCEAGWKRRREALFEPSRRTTQEFLLEMPAGGDDSLFEGHRNERLLGTGPLDRQGEDHDRNVVSSGEFLDPVA
jgi:ABC-type sulfate/molybdate transport systems ATPase subunit